MCIVERSRDISIFFEISRLRPVDSARPQKVDPPLAENDTLLYYAIQHLLMHRVLSFLCNFFSKKVANLKNY